MLARVLLSCLTLIVLSCQIGPAQAGDQRYPLDIPASDARTGLNRFAEQTGIPLFYRNEDLTNVRTSRVQGDFTATEGIEALLKDSAITGAINRSGVLTIRPRAEPVVSGKPATRTILGAIRDILFSRSGSGAAAEQGLARDRGSPAAAPALEEIMVTGSRILQSGMNTPTPVTAVSSNELANMAPTTIMDALVQLPQFLNSDTPQSQSYVSSGHAGASRINLRGVGTQRTLILLNGRRLVPSTRTGEINISLLPEALIRNVDIVTGGASAAYGSDAVSGVVNFMLDTEYDGLTGYANTGITGLGDNQSGEAGLVWGRDLGESAHLVLSGEFFHADGIEGYADRDWFNHWAAISNPDPAGPRERIVPNARSRTYTYGGMIPTGPLRGIQFAADGTPVPFVDGSLVSSITQSGGSGADPGEDVYILPHQERANAYAYLNYAIDATTSFHVQGLYGHSETSFETVPSLYTPPWLATIYIDNAFLPASLRAAMIAAGVTSFPFGRVASDADLGAGFVTNANDMISITTGFTGLFQGLQVSSYYQYGRNTARLRYDHSARIDRLYRGLDAVLDPATDRIVCRSSLRFPEDGCVPLNMFGQGSPSAAASAWITGDVSAHHQVVAQHLIEATAQGEPFTTWAGKASMMAGVAYRREELENTPRTWPPELLHQIVLPAELEGYRGLPKDYEYSTGVFERTAVRPSAYLSGGYDVWELFGETAAPLYANTAAGRRLDLNLAARYADYQGSGGIFAWKTGLEWQLAEDLRLRWTRSRDIRAGTLAERYDASIRGAGVIDPEAPPEAANYAIRQVQGGNPQVDPEVADTLTFGLVYQPSWWSGFSLSADYYDIKIAGAIALPGVQNIVDQCQAGSTLHCKLVHRNQETGQITTVDNIFQNIDEVRTRGIDIEAEYHTPVRIFGGAETLTLRGFAAYIQEASVTNPGAPKIDRAGQTGIEGGAPRWHVNGGLNYTRGPFALYLQERYLSGGAYNAVWGAADIDDNTVDPAFYTTLQLTYEFFVAGASLTLFTHVHNLLDADPPLAPDWRFAGSIHTNENLFDVLGRRFTAGLKFSF